MCGIAGIVNYDGPVDRAAAGRMISAQRHRGPDALNTGSDGVVGLGGGESVTFYRNFRTFTGKYVAHCHNLSHEDHAMMFGWEIKP